MIVTLMVGTFTVVKAYGLVPIEKTTGGYITYRGSDVQVKMPENYIQQDSDFRSVWISHLVADIASYSTEAQYKAEMERVFKTMEHFNLNAMIFHVRMNNDALYQSNLNPLASYYSSVNFDEFDPLEWIIEESHKRGIEFHAWMNPYRVSSSRTYPSYNIASNPDNIITGSGGKILDPGKPVVREFLVDTVMELIEGYDVDGIHFDDYFYISGAEDDATRAKYNTEGLSLADFRRKQVDTFIEDLSLTMREYNDQNNRVVQLGISPSGIYQNSYGHIDTADYQYDSEGNLTYPLSTNTSGFAHYGNYLYADTKKWIDNEWIDYILPQTYWALEQPIAAYASIMDWWDKVVEHKDVNLYAGMGLYMVNESGSYSWATNPREAGNQVQYTSQHKNIKGYGIYSFKHIAEAYQTKSGAIYQNMKVIKDEMWTKPSLLPEIGTYTPVTLPTVQNLNISKTAAGYRLDFDALEAAKFYAIYRSNTALTYSSSEIVDIVGKIELNDVVSYIDEVSTTNAYTYGIKAYSNTNSPGQSRSISTQSATEDGSLLPLKDFTGLFVTDNSFYNHTIKVKWDTIYPFFGGDANYEVYKSFDQENWFKITNSTNPISSTNTTHTQNVKLDGVNSKIYIKIKAFNNISESFSDIIEVDVFKKIGNITNFYVNTNNVYAGDEVEFKWNLMKDVTKVTYTLQYSEDEVTWIDITSESNPITVNEVNAIQKFTLPDNKTNYIYRVLGTNSEGKTISNTISLEVYQYIDDIDVKVNGVPYTGVVTVDEDQIVNITWDNIIHDGVRANYMTQISTNLKDWHNAKVFNTRNTLINGELESTQKVYLDFRYYTLYVRIEAYEGDGKSYSEIIELRVNVDYMMKIYFIDHFYEAQNAFINSMNIYK